MPNENELAAADTTWNPDWFAEVDNEAAIAVLDTLGPDSVEADPVTVALDAFNKDDKQTFPSSYYSSFGMDMMGDDSNLEESQEVDEESLIPDIEVSQETMDKLSPAIAIGAGEFLSKASGLKFPEGAIPKVRSAGAKGVTYLFARGAYDMGSNFADQALNIDVEGQAVAGAGAAIGTWKAVPSIVKNLISDVKIGMAAQVVDDIAAEAGSVGAKRIIERGKSMKTPKNRVMAVANKVSAETSKEVADQLAGEMHQRVGKDISRQWDDVARRLVNPNVSKKVGMYLAQHAPNLARKLAVSSAATVLPEGVSTALGVGGLMWTAWDIFNLSKQMPALEALIFQEKSDEDVVMDELTSDPNILSEEDPMDRYDTLKQIQID